jgi:hypothetical protein
MLEKFCDNDNQKRCFALIDSIIAEPLKSVTRINASEIFEFDGKGRSSYIGIVQIKKHKITPEVRNLIPQAL